MTMMDDRIVRDLAELYNDRNTPGDIQDVLRHDGLLFQRWFLTVL